jgi:hydroxymethylbilane synthase
MKIRLGTRGSDLALWQAHFTADLLGRENCDIIVIKTKGDVTSETFDKIEGKGFFTKEIEDALMNNEIDAAIHSLKDLPTDDLPELTVAAIPSRGPVEDLMIINPEFHGSGELPIKDNTVVGTSSLRRASQVKYLKRECTVKPLRGNVPTRIRKLREGTYGAIVIAGAGVERLELDLSDLIVHKVNPMVFHPAPGQGALGIQVRKNDSKTIEIIDRLSDPLTLQEVTAERTFLHHFGGGCHIPLGAYCYKEEGRLVLKGSVTSPDGTIRIEDEVTGSDPVLLGSSLAEILKARGAGGFV